MVVVAVLVFAIVPDWLASGVLAGSPLLRDLLIVAWATVGFFFLAWLVVRLQSGRDL